MLACRHPLAAQRAQACAPTISVHSYPTSIFRTPSVWTIPSPTAAQSPAPARGYATSKTRINKLPRLAPASAVSATSGTDAFFSTQHDTFAGLGVSAALQQALETGGFERPSRVQELAAPHILRGRNVVITSETGSGKTLAYVVPIAHLMMKQRSMIEEFKRKQEEEERARASSGDAAEPSSPPPLPPRRYHALVLCPNMTLCQQVVAAVNALRGPDGEPLVTAAAINSSNPPPFDAPDVIAATPAGLLTLLNNSGGAYGWLWSEEGLQTRVRHVILDESDLLLGAAYSRATIKLLTMFKVGDRRRVEAVLFPELGITDKGQYDRLPRPLQVAGWRGGVPAMLAEGYRPERPLDPDAKYGPYWRRQYIYAAATMPAVTYSDVGSMIQKAHPDAEWVSTELLHTSKPSVAHVWHEVTDDSFAPTLLEAIRSDPAYAARQGKTLVFAGDGAAADNVSHVLTGGGVPHVVYHKSRPVSDQAAALEALRSRQGTVMVCTDAAARGLDVADIGHVIQADFAPNAIDFIHRIGRTARAGREGRVTSLFRDRNRPLVDVLRDYVEQGVPLEAAFSRARSFTKKMRKTGGVFVPRGLPVAEAGGRREEGEEEGEGVEGRAEGRGRERERARREVGGDGQGEAGEGDEGGEEEREERPRGGRDVGRRGGNIGGRGARRY
ncbi:hypothetical protein HYH03_002860 [Edaphochlamys debaryana]|uniref:Uncharacterized protein n=1 Tax=Edaphochlamys debaryana TaxID=47281 RepID=A0A835YCW8_9CHLO|nr:hypothetical protein HYH03_002860 [Edaphochlamys debaryana]|eukprot:KAG2499282.1 hypothetical protein HYH03_002860 [Edaphochlamys debaryana]